MGRIKYVRKAAEDANALDSLIYRGMFGTEGGEEKVSESPAVRSK